MTAFIGSCFLPVATTIIYLVFGFGLGFFRQLDAGIEGASLGRRFGCDMSPRIGDVSGEPKLNWDSAQVGEYRDLTVGFTAPLPDSWQDEFRSAAELRNRETRGPWGPIGMQFNDLVHVRGVDPASVTDLKADLDSLVDQVTARLAQRQQQDEVHKRRQEDEAATREETAKRMQDEFRS